MELGLECWLVVWSLEAGVEGAYEADCDMVDPKREIFI